MATPDRRSLVEAIRAAAKLAIEETSLRRVAREVGMSPMGLKHFVEGTQPYSATYRKLIAWYNVYQARAGGFSEDAARGALVVLVDGLPEPMRGRALAVVIDAILKLHAEAGTRPPAWLAALRAEV
jgi:hypothetical protein